MRPLPDRERVVLRHVLERQAVQRPDATCVVFDDETAWSFDEAVAEAYRSARVLAGCGVQRGDRVLLFLPKGPGWLRAWWGTAFLGAVIVPVNVAYRGEMLRHVCADAEATAVVADDLRWDRLADVGMSLPRVEPSELAAGPDAPVQIEAPIEPWDVAAVMYTSGTTGPSKGVLCTAYQAYCNATLWTSRTEPDDRILIDLPLYHIGGTYPSLAAWTKGAGIALVDTFSASEYLDRIRRLRVTQTLFVGTMAAFLAHTPEETDDAESPWRSAMCAPLPPDPQEFCRRFGLDEIWTTFGMTEISAPFVSPRGTCDVLGVGRLRSGYEVRLVDEHDVPVGEGEVGELVLRHEHPWSITPGYHGNPQATARAWRNGWFHTGDAFTRSADGDYFFVDRMKDAIRRRGENISSFEVERAVVEYPPVVEAAAVGVPTPYGEEDVKVFVVVEREDGFDPAGLIEFLEPRMPYFMVPRFVEVVSELPVSANARVQKATLRERGNREATWDREAAGITVSKD